MPHYADLPSSTVDLLVNQGMVTVSQAQAWASAALDAGFVTDSVLALYSLNDDKTEECAGLARAALADVGAWRDTELGRLGVRRNVLVHGLVTDRISPYHFVVGALQIAIELLAQARTHLSDDMHLTRDAFHRIEDALSLGHPEPTSVDSVDLKSWIVSELRKARILDNEGATVLADWGK